MISAVPAIEPNQPERRFDLGGGVTWAIGTPNRVTSTGLRVFRTRSITDTYRRPCDAAYNTLGSLVSVPHQARQVGDSEGGKISRCGLSTINVWP